jgi:hypothetical protein
MYQQEGSEPVIVDRENVEQLVPNVVTTRLNLEDDTLARHDPERVVHAIFDLEAAYIA